MRRSSQLKRTWQWPVRTLVWFHICFRLPCEKMFFYSDNTRKDLFDCVIDKEEELVRERYYGVFWNHSETTYIFKWTGNLKGFFKKSVRRQLAALCHVMKWFYYIYKSFQCKISVLRISSFLFLLNIMWGFIRIKPIQDIKNKLNAKHRQRTFKWGIYSMFQHFNF